jgi:hypothetical protein
MEKIIQLKGSESFIVGIMMLFLAIILIIPVCIIILLKFLFTSLVVIKEEMKAPERISYKLEKIY